MQNEDPRPEEIEALAVSDEPVEREVSPEDEVPFYVPRD